MSRYIATRAIRGANAIVAEADALLTKAIAEKGADTPVAFPNTAYYLPVILGMLGHEASKLGDLEPVMQHAKRMLHPMPDKTVWTPYLGETLDCGMATLLAEEVIEGVRFVYGEEPQPYPGLALAGSTSFTSPDNGAQIVGHPTGRRPHAGLRGDRRCSALQRSGGRYRPRASETEHPHFPRGERQRSVDDRSTA
jgi:acetyl-CoA synthase